MVGDEMIPLLANNLPRYTSRSMKRLGCLLILLAVTTLAGCGGGSSGSSGGGGGGEPPPVIPSLTAIAPSGAAVGSAKINLAVYGSNFTQNAAVQWNGAALSAMWISATEMTATVPAADLTSAGAAKVTVVNDGGAGASAYLQ